MDVSGYFKALKLTLFLCLTSLFSYAQNEKVETKGKAFSPSLGVSTHLQLSHLDFLPVINFEIGERLDIGLGCQYVYYYRNSDRIKKQSFGFNAYTRIYPVKSFFVHGEYTFSNVPYRNKRIYEFKRVNVANILAGVGFKQPITDHLDTYFTVLYDFTHTDYSIYENKILFRVGVTF